MNTLYEDQSNVVANEQQHWIDLNFALERLYKNEDFKRVILQGYFEKRAVDGVSLLAQDSIVQSGRRTSVMEELIAISKLQDYFMTIKDLGFVPEEDEFVDQE